MIDKKEFEKLPQIIKTLFTEYVADECLYWYPLNSLKKDIPVVAYNLDAIYKDGNIAQIAACLKSASISVCDVFQLQENNSASRRVNLLELLYERDADGYNFPWNVESYYFDGDSSEWIIYVSHEGTITFTGEKIVEITKITVNAKYRME